MKGNEKKQDHWYGLGKTRAKQGRHQDNDVTRIIGKANNKGIGKVKGRSNGKTRVVARALQWYNKFSKKYKGKNK